MTPFDIWEHSLADQLGISQQTLRLYRRECTRGEHWERHHRRIMWSREGVEHLRSLLGAREDTTPAEQDPPKKAPASGEDAYPILARVANNGWMKWTNTSLVGIQVLREDGSPGELALCLVKPDIRTMFRPGMLIGVAKYREPNYYTTRRPKKIGTWSYDLPSQ